jgi:hypothetical protein
MRPLLVGGGTDFGGSIDFGRGTDLGRRAVLRRTADLRAQQHQGERNGGYSSKTVNDPFMFSVRVLAQVYAAA